MKSNPNPTNSTNHTIQPQKAIQAKQKTKTHPTPTKRTNQLNQNQKTTQPIQAHQSTDLLSDSLSLSLCFLVLLYFISTSLINFLFILSLSE